jgi:mono/diheme cytochrome c family protein
MNQANRSLQLAAASVLALYLTPALPFTAEQAAAGRAAYQQNCVACHGADLMLLPTARLAGPEFTARYSAFLPYIASLIFRSIEIIII